MRQLIKPERCVVGPLRPNHATIVPVVSTLRCYVACLLHATGQSDVDCSARDCPKSTLCKLAKITHQEYLLTRDNLVGLQNVTGIGSCFRYDGRVPKPSALLSWWRQEGTRHLRLAVEVVV